MKIISYILISPLRIFDEKMLWAVFKVIISVTNDGRDCPLKISQDILIFDKFKSS